VERHERRYGGPAIASDREVMEHEDHTCGGGGGRAGVRTACNSFRQRVVRHEDHTWGGGKAGVRTACNSFRQRVMRHEDQTCWSRIRIHSLDPRRLAIMKGVFPFYKENGNEVKIKRQYICVLLPLTLTLLPYLQY
jgi:hypothetical protein